MLAPANTSNGLWGAALFYAVTNLSPESTFTLVSKAGLPKAQHTADAPGLRSTTGGQAKFEEGAHSAGESAC